MTDLTELHGWDLPVPDSISQEDRDTYGVPIRNFWDEDLDKEVPMRGPEVDRPTAGDFPGLIWIVTDSTPIEITYDTGTEWVVIGTTDTRTNISDDGTEILVDTSDINFATNLAVSDDGDGSVSIDGGGDAVFDSINSIQFLTADLTEANVRDAINTAASGSVFVIEPGASWTLTAALQPPTGTTIIGNTTRATSPTFTKSFNGTLVEMANYCVLENIGLNGNRGNGFTGDVVDGLGNREFILRNCLIEQAENDGMRAAGFFMTIEACMFRNNGGYGLRFPDTTAGEQPHNNISGPSYIGGNDAGGIYLGDADTHGKNLQIHAWIGDNGGPGITSIGTWRSLDVMGQFTNNDGPAWLQNGGNTRVTFRSCVIMINNQSPDTGLTTPVGDIHVESGSLKATLITPFTGTVPQLINAPSSSTSQISIVTAEDLNGDISGSNLQLSVTDASAITGAVNVGSAVALDSAEGDGSIRTGSDLSKHGEEGCSVVMGSNQSLPSATQTVVEFDTVANGDTDAFDATNFEFVAPTDGQYRLDSQIRVMNLDSQVNLYAYSSVNGRESRTRYNNFVSEGWPRTHSTVSLSAGDRMWVQAHTDDADGGDIDSPDSESYADFWRV